MVVVSAKREVKHTIETVKPMSYYGSKDDGGVSLLENDLGEGSLLDIFRARDSNAWKEMVARMERGERVKIL